MTIERILHLLEITNTSAKALTEATSLSNSAISEWKKNKAAPSAAAIVKIADFFSVPVTYLLETDVFANWDDILAYKDDVWYQIHSVDMPNAYLKTKSGKSVPSLFYEALYTEPDDLKAIRLFSWAIKKIDIAETDENWANVTIEYSEGLELIIERKPRVIRGHTLEEMLKNFQSRMEEQEKNKLFLNDDEQQIIALYRALDDTGKGVVLDNIRKYSESRNRFQA